MCVSRSASCAERGHIRRRSTEVVSKLTTSFLFVESADQYANRASQEDLRLSWEPRRPCTEMQDSVEGTGGRK